MDTASDLQIQNEHPVLTLAKDMTGKAVILPNQTLLGIFETRMLLIEFLGRVTMGIHADPTVGIRPADLGHVVSLMTMKQFLTCVEAATSTAKRPAA